ncbi:MAG: LA_2272 family surface repeat-containing protein [Desulfobacterales bacterium]
MNKLIMGVFSLIAGLVISLIVSPAAFAQSRPFQASLTPDIAIHDRSVMIEGLTLSVWGENPQKALSLGVVNGSTGESVGFSLGLLLNYSESYKGVQWAPVNYTKQDFFGWQHGFINYTDQRIKGVQTGWLNYAGKLKGLQLGLFNYAETAETGFQIGIINVIPENRWFRDFPDSVAPGMVFVNWRF